jgi:hypothetical protein
MFFLAYLGSKKITQTSMASRTAPGKGHKIKEVKSRNNNPALKTAEHTEKLTIDSDEEQPDTNEKHVETDKKKQQLDTEEEKADTEEEEQLESDEDIVESEKERLDTEEEKDDTNEESDNSDEEELPETDEEKQSEIDEDNQSEIDEDNQSEIDEDKQSENNNEEEVHSDDEKKEEVVKTSRAQDESLEMLVKQKPRDKSVKLDGKRAAFSGERNSHKNVSVEKILNPVAGSSFTRNEISGGKNYGVKVQPLPSKVKAKSNLPKVGKVQKVSVLI